MPDPYGSHLPVLRILSVAVPMRHVLEFGAGHHSTAFFLSLPQLERLVSVETDPAWRREVKSEDPRHTVVPKAPPLDGFDFVFIDDGTTADERVETIRRVLTVPHPTVAVHDAEVDDYAEAIREHAQGRVFISKDRRPHTAVIWPKEAE